MRLDSSSGERPDTSLSLTDSARTDDDVRRNSLGNTIVARNSINHTQIQKLIPFT